MWLATDDEPQYGVTPTDQTWWPSATTFCQWQCHIQHTFLLELDEAEMMPVTSDINRLEIVWKHRRMAIVTADRCFCFVQQHDTVVDLGHLMMEASAGVERRQEAQHPLPHRTSQLHHRPGRLPTQLPSARTSRTLGRDGGRQMARTRQWHQVGGKTWPVGQADQNLADCLLDTDSAQLSNTATTKQSTASTIFLELSPCPITHFTAHGWLPTSTFNQLWMDVSSMSQSLPQCCDAEAGQLNSYVQ